MNGVAEVRPEASLVQAKRAYQLKNRSRDGFFSLPQKTSARLFLPANRKVYSASMKSTSDNPTPETNTQNDTTPEPEPSLESLEETMGTPPSEQFAEQPSEPTPLSPESAKPPRNRKKAILLMVAVLLLSGAAAAYWFIVRESSSSTNTSQQQPVVEPASKKDLKPSTIAYSYRETTSGETQNCGPNKSNKLYARPIAGGERVEAGNAPANSVFTMFDINQNHIVAAASAGCDGGSETIWYSADAGNTYTSIYTGKKPDQKDGLGEQITSVKLASDASSIVFGSLDADTFKNTIKEIDLTSKTVKDLKATDVAGVFIEGYNKPAQTLYYFTGCFQCDGVSRDKLMAYNTAISSESVLVDQSSADTVGLEAVFNNDFTKLLTSRGSAGEFLGGGAPYTIQEYDIAQKTTTKLATVNDEDQYLLNLGYTADQQLPFYSEGKSVYVVAADGKASAVFEASGRVFEVYYMSKDLAVLSAYNTISPTDFTLVSYDYKTKKATTILQGDEDTRIFGVGAQ